MARRVVVKVDADSKSAVDNINKITSSIDKLGKETKDVASAINSKMESVSGAFQKIASLAIVAFAVDKIKNFTTAMLDYGDRLQKLNVITGISIETLDKLSQAGDLAGISLEDIVTSVKKLVLKLEETGPAADSTARYLKAIGISAEDIKKQSIEEQFITIAEAIGKVSDKSIQNKLSFELMGKSASELLPLLIGFRKNMNEVSTVLDQKTVDSFAVFNDNMTKAYQNLNKLLLPKLAELTEAFNKAYDAAGTGLLQNKNQGKAVEESFIEFPQQIGQGKSQKEMAQYNKMRESWVIMRTEQLNAIDVVNKKQEEIDSKTIVVDPKSIADPIPQKSFDKWQTDFEQATMKKYDFEKLQLEKSRDNSIKEGQSKEQAYATYTAKLAELDKNRLAIQKKDAEETKKLIDDLYEDEYKAFKESNDKIIALREERDAFIDKSTLTSFELQRKELDADFKRFEAVTINKIALLQAYGEASKKITAEETADKTAKSEAAIEKNKTALQKWAESVQTTDAMFTDMAIKFSEGVADGIVDALDKWFDGTMKAKDAMKAFAASFLKDIAKMILQQTILNSLKSGFSSGGFFSSLIGGGSSLIGGGSSIASPESYFMANGGLLPGGFKAFASGGKVTKPTLGLVGEGMYNEAVVPLPDGNTIPVKLSGGSGGSSLNIVNNVTVASGSGGSDKDRQDMANKTSQAIESKVREIIGQEKRYGGLLYGA